MSQVTARVRTGTTLSALVALVVIGTLWGWQALTTPLPKSAEEDEVVCVEETVTSGTEVRPSQIVVTVLNATSTSGLANSTMRKLTARGFSRGAIDDAPDDTEVGTAEIWVTDQNNPGAALVQSYLGPDVEIKETVSARPGVTVIVGAEIKRLRKGKTEILAETNTTICSPAPV